MGAGKVCWQAVTFQGERCPCSRGAGTAAAGVGSCASIGLALLLGLVQAAGAQCTYSVTLIAGPECPPYGTPPTFGTGLNEAGEVCGTYTACTLGPNTPFVWSAETGLVVLQIPSSSEATARGISLGYVVGYYENPHDKLSYLAFLMQGEAFTEIPPPAGGLWIQAYGVNVLGQVVGAVHNPPTNSSEAFFSDGGVMTVIDPSPQYGSIAWDVNDLGQVVGETGSTAPSVATARAFISENGKVTILPPIPGGVTSAGSAINNKGDVVGSGLLQAGVLEYRPFLWSNGTMRDLGNLPGFEICGAAATNDHGAVVGGCVQSENNPNLRAGWIWQHGVMRNLNELVDPKFPWTIQGAGEINNAGQILGGIGGLAVLLTPEEVPVGDLDHDCHVGIVDFLLLLGSWGGCAAGEQCGADLNGDNLVDGADFTILLQNWG